MDQQILRTAFFADLIRVFSVAINLPTLKYILYLSKQPIHRVFKALSNIEY